MNVLIIGSGGRENALVKKISESKLLGKLYCCPGNPGTENYCENIPVDINDFEAISNIIINKEINMVVPGPEGPLVDGLRDFLRKRSEFDKVLFAGPDKKGANLEGSKDYAKSFMLKYCVPTASYKSFESNETESAFAFLETLKSPYVIKADGLAAGKGVLILNYIDEAKEEIKSIFEGKFGHAGDKIVIEEYLDGVELSVFILTDGREYMILPSAKDYKRALDNDKGLNTGGMGAVSPVPFADETFMKKVEERIIKPTVAGLEAEGIKYDGFLFIGLMNCNGEPYVIEFNVRMGDPESEAVFPRIQSDLLSHLKALCEGTLSSERLQISNKQALTVVCVSGGYPGVFEKGHIISGIEDVQDCMVFHSGTAKSGHATVTNGGRVLAVTTFAVNIEEAREHLYRELKKVNYKNIYYRSDIGLDLI